MQSSPIPGNGTRDLTGDAGDHLASPLVPAQRVIEKSVFDVNGDNVGKVEDLAIDKLTGKVAYVILTFGGFMGVGGKYYPAPWSMLTYQPEKGGFVLPCSADELRAAPGFDRDQLSGWHAKNDRQSVDTFYHRWTII